MTKISSGVFKFSNQKYLIRVAAQQYMYMPHQSVSIRTFLVSSFQSVFFMPLISPSGYKLPPPDIGPTKTSPQSANNQHFTVFVIFRSWTRC